MEGQDKSKIAIPTIARKIVNDLTTRYCCSMIFATSNATQQLYSGTPR